MAFPKRSRVASLRDRLRRALTGPHVLAFLPALALGSFWIGGESLLVVVALGLPILFALSGRFDPAQSGPFQPRDPDLADANGALEMAQTALDAARGRGMHTACLLVEVEGLEPILQRFGEQPVQSVQDLVLSRLRTLLRKGDRAVRISDARFQVLLGPAPRLDLESLLQVAKRLQGGLEEPVSVVGSTQYLSVSIGFCSSTRLAEDAGGQQIFEAAAAALGEALANGPSAIRAWSDSVRAVCSARASLRSDAAHALENGQIQPWYQPQVCTSTGQVSGLEALARWIHPERGVIAPAQFLAALEDDQRMERLGEVMVNHALTALRTWDNAGCVIPRASVNFSMFELRNPKLVDKIAWELDRFSLSPQRLGVEVLETVIAGTSDGIVARNIDGLAKLGCHIDLDDFGVGHASITALRRFPVHRLKIDRSFVTRIDRDEEQRRMIAAVLGLADRLGLRTVAEGVESVGEHALLAQLGCDHVQGFGIARPMPADQIPDWIATHQSRVADAAQLARRSS